MTVEFRDRHHISSKLFAYINMSKVLNAVCEIVDAQHMQTMYKSKMQDDNTGRIYETVYKSGE